MPVIEATFEKPPDGDIRFRKHFGEVVVKRNEPCLITHVSHFAQKSKIVFKNLRVGSVLKNKSEQQALRLC
jgi:hypothetical protein